jgi:hypothetical protein
MRVFEILGASESKSRYDVEMAMQKALALTLFLVSIPAAADTFGGFSGVDKPYLVNQDKVCTPLAVKDGAASGAPTCEKAPADTVAHLSIKEPVVQRGLKASFVATAAGKTLTVARKSGETLVTWNAPDAIGKVVDVYASQYEDRVAVAYTTRVLGKEVTNVVAFEIVKTTGRTEPTTTTTQPTTTTTPTTTTAPPEDPKVKKAVDAARKASKAKALAAWQAVQAIDPEHSEARYRIAAIQVGAKQTADATATLDKLAKSSRSDAIEWLVEARFDKAFAPVRADAKFRAAVGLDRKGTTPYERLMGFGGQWEQTGTSCEAPEVRLTTNRDRTFKVSVKSSCRGDVFTLAKKGTWRIEGDNVVLTIPTKGQKVTEKDETRCELEPKGDEDALHCVLDRDLEFTVLPTRR